MADLELLDTYLSSDVAHPDSMAISDLDGFLTGIICGPEPIPAREWLNVALGNVEAVPDDVVAAVTEMYQETLELLEDSQVSQPVFWESQDGREIAMDWCEGFMEAVKLRPERWDVFSQTKTGSELMLPILVHILDEGGNSLLDIAQEDLDATLEAAVEAIPVIVPGIYRQIRVVTRN